MFERTWAFLVAMGNEDGNLQYDGYYFWACLGFENRDVPEFAEWAARWHRKESTLSELVQTKEGLDLWKAEGGSWRGIFYLADGHPCTHYLKAHLRRKGIDIILP